MTTTISDADALKFTSNVELLSQQLISKLEDTVMVRDFEGEGAQDVQQVGSVDLDAVVSIDADTNYGSPTHTSRWLYPSPFDKAFLLDKISLVKTIADFKNEYVRTLSVAAFRKVDDEIITNYYGTAKTGKQGGTSTSFTAANEIAATVGAAAATGLNPEKVMKALEVLKEGEGIDDSGTDEMYAVIAPKQRTDLLRFVEVASGDFTAKSAYSTGQIPPGWMGINWRISNRLPTSAGNRRNMLYVKSGVCLGYWIRPTPELFLNPAKKNNWTAQMRIMLGATRREEAKCASILCAES
jgi:hypothetical protein